MDETFAPRIAPTFSPTLAAAHARIAALRPGAYARTCNALDGAVSQLSPYITHGFVGSRMAALASERWYADAGVIGAAMKSACRVRTLGEPHLAASLARFAECETSPAHFPPVHRRCDSFSQWWNRVSRGLDSASDLLAVNEVPEW